jgi:acetoacetyl-CoA reductase
MSSMNSLNGQAGQANYAAATAGLIALTKCIAQETAVHGITANRIAPGFLDIDMTRAIRPDIRHQKLAKISAGPPGSPAEVAKLLRYLMSEAAALVTGETVSINDRQWMA